jgi:outer membrane autotransporter protein
VEFSTIDRTARASQDSGEFSTLLGGGYDFQVGNFTIGPAASLQYTYFGVAPFTESGAESLNLRVDQQNANSLQSYIGGRVAYTWNVTDTITLIPEGRMFWQHEFLQNPRTIGASLDGGSGPNFDYTTSTPDRDAVFAGAGLIGQFGKNLNAYIYYNADFGRQDFVSHTISTGLNFKF